MTTLQFQCLHLIRYGDKVKVFEFNTLSQRAFIIYNYFSNKIDSERNLAIYYTNSKKQFYITHGPQQSNNGKYNRTLVWLDRK